MRVLWTVCILVFGVFTNALAQHVLGYFLLIEPSAGLHGIASSGTGLSTTDPFGFYYNPAQLGIPGKGSRVSTGLTHFNWLTGLVSDVSFLGYSFSLGRFLGSNTFPANVGVGYMRGQLDWGPYYWMAENGELAESRLLKTYDLYSIGAGILHPFKAGIGLSYKSIVDREECWDCPPGKHLVAARPKAVDIGFLVSVPIRRSGPEGDRDGVKRPRMLRTTDFSLGAVMSNIGGKVSYEGEDSEYLLPRQATLGYGFRSSLRVVSRQIEISILSLEFAGQASSWLVESSSDGIGHYLSFPGKINLYKHVLLGKGDAFVRCSRGISANVMETVSLGVGEFNDDYGKVATFGLGMSTRGLFKVLTLTRFGKPRRGILQHLDITFSWSMYVPVDSYSAFEQQTFKSLRLAFLDF